MAIVSLGTRNVVIGDSPVAFNSFAFNQQLAYILYVSFTSAGFQNIFSVVRVRPRVEVAGSPTAVVAPFEELEIIPAVQILYFPASRLFGGNGNVTYLVERVSRIYGGDDGTEVTMELLYNDSMNVPSWRN